MADISFFSANYADNMSRQTLFNYRFSHHRPSIERELPHHTDTLFRRGVEQVWFLPLLGERSLADDDLPFDF